MKNYRQRLDILEQEMFIDYISIDKKTPIVIEEYNEDHDYDNWFQYTNDLTGQAIDCHVLDVSEEGIKVIGSMDDEIIYIGFHDLTSTMDRVNLLELIHLKTNNSNETKDL